MPSRAGAPGRAFAAEGIALDVSTLADWVGRACATLAPLQERIRAHVLGAKRLHGDDTTVPVLARKKTVTGRIWTYVRDVSVGSPGAKPLQRGRGHCLNSTTP